MQKSLKFWIAINLLVSLASHGAAAAEGMARAGSSLDADQVLKEVEKKITAQDESARIEMTIGEANGSSKSREIEVLRKSEKDGQKVRVRLQSPPDLRGTALLSVKSSDQEDQWLYLPSSKQARRVLSNKKSSSFLDSELSYEDLGGGGGAKYTHTVLRTEANSDGSGGSATAVIESKSNSTESTYGKIRTWVPLKSHLVSQIEYYDRSGKLLKTSRLSGYREYGGGVWRAMNIRILNAQNHRFTELTLKDLSLNQSVSDQEFSVAALNDD